VLPFSLELLDFTSYQQQWEDTEVTNRVTMRNNSKHQGELVELNHQEGYGEHQVSPNSGGCSDV